MKRIALAFLAAIFLPSILSAQAIVVPSGGSASGNTISPNLSVITVSRACPPSASTCTQIVGDASFDVDATFTASSPTVTTSAAAPAFVAASVPNQIGWGTYNCSANSEESCTNNCPQSTMTYVSAHVVTLSNNCTNNSSATAHSNNFLWGTDDGTALASAFSSMFPAGGNSPSTQELDLPAGNFIFTNNPFVAPGINPRQNPIILRGHNTFAIPAPNMSCSQGSNHGCLFWSGFSNNVLGNVGSADAVYDITFWGGGTSDKGTSATYSNPTFGVTGTYGANFYNVWVMGWVWNRSCSTPAYGWRLSGSSTFGSGDYAGGNFGAFTLGFIGSPTDINGGNWGAGACSDIVVTGTAQDGGVTVNGVYLDQPQIVAGTCGGSAAFANCYGVQVQSGVLHMYGSEGSAFVNGGDAWLMNNELYGFSSVDDLNISSGTVALQSNQFGSHIQQSGGTMFFAGGNHSNASTAPFINPSFQTLTGGSAIAYQSVSGTCTGTVPASATAGGLYGTGENITATVCATIGGTTKGNGRVMQQAGTMGMLQVAAGTAGTNSSSGVFTVLQNGSATTITCTVGTGTSCVDVTHYVSYAAGDLISIQYTSQSADTLANVKASVMTAF